ncbi:hypothetical protein EAH79_13790 [Sphingomonas koreensis]|nr:hypothetical protein EAH79_13790 [Sphingomonas koreensis]
MSEHFYGDVYAREVVHARVGHLIWRKQQEVERICRILRTFFEPGDVLTTQPGQILRIILIGPYAKRSWYEDKHTMFFSDYEFWVIVNLPVFTDERHWEAARQMISREVGNRCAVTLMILSKDDVKRARAARDCFILDRIEAGITLYKASRDAPLPGAHDTRSPRAPRHV